MIKYCYRQWYKNEKHLKEIITQNIKEIEYCDYEYLVKLVIDNILNYGEDFKYKWNSEKIKTIDDGDYQGTILFLIPLDTYQPYEDNYLITYESYGSCSGCDTLMAIQDSLYCNEPISEQTINDIMTLCRDLVMHMIVPYSDNSDFATIQFN